MLLNIDSERWRSKRCWDNKVAAGEGKPSMNVLGCRGGRERGIGFFLSLLIVHGWENS